MKSYYPSEKFSLAVDILATTQGTLQERIANAFTYSLHLLGSEDDLPADVKWKLKQNAAAWSAVDDQHGRGKIAVWASLLSDNEATKIASWVVETAWKLHGEYWEAAELQPSH